VGCKRLDTDFFNFLEVVSSEKSACAEKKRINYYPFGLLQKGYNNIISGNSNAAAEKFGFGGKELQDKLGLEWYDVSARNYDPALGRWMNVDPLAESFASFSPYTYVYNNPLNYTDSTGMCPDGDCPDPPAEMDGGTLDTVTITVSKSRKNFDYSEMSGNMRSSGASEVQWWNSSYNGTLQQYNNEYGTNYGSHNPGNAHAQWAYQFHYKPRKYKYMADFYKGRGEMSRGALAIIAVGLSPILAAEAAVAGGALLPNTLFSSSSASTGISATNHVVNGTLRTLVRNPSTGRFVSNYAHMQPANSTIIGQTAQYANYGLNSLGQITSRTALNMNVAQRLPDFARWAIAIGGSSAIVASKSKKE
jgi:RHS repeat-associated protein